MKSILLTPQKEDLSFLREEARALLPLLKKHRRFLHRHAEVGFALTETMGYIKKELSRLGISYRDCGGGVLASFGEGQGGVLLRADADALPIGEQTGLPFAANGAMHACGHDMHTAMLLGAATLLSRARARIKAKITLLFQPAEELLSGASAMLRDGALADAPRAAFCVHVLPASGFQTGTLILPPAGTVTAAADFFSVRFRGKGAHGAMPEEGVNPLSAAAHTLLALEALPLKEAKAGDAVLTVGYLRGGEAANAIPDTAELGGSLRTHGEEARRHLLMRIDTLSRGIASAFRTSAAVQVEKSCPPLKNDPALREKALPLLTRVFGREGIKEAPPISGKPRGGSEDFAFIAERVPSFMLSVAANPDGGGEGYPLHHPRVTFDEKALLYGCAAYTAMGLYL